MIPIWPMPGYCLSSTGLPMERSRAASRLVLAGETIVSSVPVSSSMGGRTPNGAKEVGRQVRLQRCELRWRQFLHHGSATTLLSCNSEVVSELGMRPSIDPV